MYRTKIVWTEKPRPHRSWAGITVKEGDWLQKSPYLVRDVEVLKIKAYIEGGFIIAAVLQRPDYDPCGRTDWITTEDWSSE